MKEQKTAERITITTGDITEFRGDAVVNAANSSLLGGGGVDGAVHRAAGPGLLTECRTLGGCPTGEARITRGYRLPARYIIHTVGPVWKGGSHGEAGLLASAYHSSLALAEQYQLASVAFCAISTGVYGYPLEEATVIALTTILQWLTVHTMPQKVTCVCFDTRFLTAYKSTFAALTGKRSVTDS